MTSDPVYIASVAETVRSSLRNTTKPGEVRRYLLELRDALCEGPFEDNNVFDELLAGLNEHIEMLRPESLGQIDDVRRKKIIDHVHRVERFCQRHQDRVKSNSEDKSQSSYDTSPSDNSQSIAIDLGIGNETKSLRSHKADNSEQPDSVNSTERCETNVEASPFDSLLDITTERGSSPGNKEQWQFPASAEFVGAPTANEEVVCAATADGYLYAVKTDSGKLDWRFGVSEDTAYPPVLGGKTVYSGDKRRELYAIDTDNGEEKWRFDIDVDSDKGLRDGYICANKETVYVCGGGSLLEGYLYAIDAVGGYKKWSFEIKDRVHSVTMDDERVYCVSAEGGLYALDRWSGDRLWHFKSDDVNYYSTTVSNETVYVAGNSILYAVNTTTGAERWRTKIRMNGLQPSVIHDGILYVKSWFGLIAVDTANGDRKWSFELDTGLGSPAIRDGTVFINNKSVGGRMPEKPCLYALDADSGQAQWSFQGDGYLTPPAVRDRTVYVGSKNGSLYALTTKMN